MTRSATSVTCCSDLCYNLTMTAKKNINATLVTKLASFALTQEEIAAVCGCCRDTIQKKYHDAWERGQVLMKASLKRRQFIKALREGNTTMLIWLGKQHLGQRDNLDVSGDHTHRYYMEGPEKTESADDWQQQYSPEPKSPTMQ